MFTQNNFIRQNNIHIYILKDDRVFIESIKILWKVSKVPGTQLRAFFVYNLNVLCNRSDAIHDVNVISNITEEIGKYHVL